MEVMKTNISKRGLLKNPKRKGIVALLSVIDMCGLVFGVC